MTERLRHFHRRSLGTYGASRIYADLTEEGLRVGRKRVTRLLRDAGLSGVSRRRRLVTTRCDPVSRPAPDLVQRRFRADGPVQLWVAVRPHRAAPLTDALSGPARRVRLH